MRTERRGICEMTIDRKAISEVLDLMKTTTVVAVTKTVGSATIRELATLGITDVGENRATDLLSKKAGLCDLPLVWHFIGTLQSNKVKRVINEIDWLHSLDRESLAIEIQKHRQTKLNCFVEVHLTDEPTKAGLLPELVVEFCQNMVKYDKIVIVGLMGMAPLNADEGLIRDCFLTLARLRDQVRDLGLPHAPCKFLSMGMTNDYKIALACGATHLRLGRILYCSKARD